MRSEMELFEQELHRAFERQPAPAGLKSRILAQRNLQRRQRQVAIWQRLAASLVVATAVAGGVQWRSHEERRKGEEAREQVMTALRIANRALDKVNTRLAEHGQPER